MSAAVPFDVTFDRDERDAIRENGSVGESLDDVVQRWTSEGPLVRVPTGIPTLDTACRGGMPIPWRVFLVGAPSAGKTAIAAFVARNMIPELYVGILAVDEEADDLTVRFAQMCGFEIEDCEQRDPAKLARISDALRNMPIRIYSPDTTIEAAATDLSSRGEAAGKRVALFIDSVQTAHSEGARDAQSTREFVDCNVRAIRMVATQYRMLVVATSEANRGAYRSDDPAQRGNSMAAGKESGSIEFSAQTLMMVRTPKGHRDVVHVEVPKNRRGADAAFEFYLHFDRARHELSECADPNADDDGLRSSVRDEKRRTANRASVERDAKELASAVRMQPGIGERALRAAIRSSGFKWGVERLDAARTLLGSGLNGERLVNRGDGRECKWHLESSATGDGGSAND